MFLVARRKPRSDPISQFRQEPKAGGFCEFLPFSLRSRGNEDRHVTERTRAKYKVDAAESCQEIKIGFVCVSVNVLKDFDRKNDVERRR